MSGNWRAPPIATRRDVWNKITTVNGIPHLSYRCIAGVTPRRCASSTRSLTHFKYLCARSV
eukprot:4613633-Karenia_brevis.AAC.1